MGNASIKLKPVYNEHRRTTILREAINGLAVKDVQFSSQEEDILPQDCNSPKTPWTNWGRNVWLQHFDNDADSARIDIISSPNRPISHVLIRTGTDPSCRLELPKHLVPNLVADFNSILGQ